MRRFLLLLCALAVAAVLAGAAHAGSFTKTDTTISMSDGVGIAATFYEPSGAAPAGGWPAVMIFHGLGQTRTSTELNNVSWNQVAETLLAPNGYAVLTFDARAHGQSGGLFSLDGPREIQDTRELFAWLVSHPEIDAKHVGAFGVSYGGGNIWLSAAAGIPFAAIVPAATWTDLHDALAPGNAIRGGIVLGFSQNIPPAKYDPGLAGLLQDALQGRNLEAVRAFQASRSVRPQLAAIATPTFLVQGRRDFAFDADQALAAYRRLSGPKRLYLGDLGHAPAANPPAEWTHVETEVRRWFDRYLKNEPNGIDKEAPVELAHDPWDGRTSTFTGLPQTRSLRYALRGRSTLGAEGKVVRTTARLAKLETFGAATIRVTASGTGFDHLVAVLSARTPAGKEIVVSDGAAGLLSWSASTRTVAISLPDEITSIPRGSRFRVTLAARSTLQDPGNLVYLNSVATDSRLTVTNVRVDVPVLRVPVSR